jgi:hypothetical protein
MNPDEREDARTDAAPTTRFSAAIEQGEVLDQLRLLRRELLVAGCVVTAVGGALGKRDAAMALVLNDCVARVLHQQIADCIDWLILIHPECTARSEPDITAPDFRELALDEDSNDADKDAHLRGEHEGVPPLVQQIRESIGKLLTCSAQSIEQLLAAHTVHLTRLIGEHKSGAA